VTRVVRTRDELAAARARLGEQLGPTGTLGLVPTMGALHGGHLALLDAARSGCDAVVASIFVNPMQFSQAGDLERYPRPLADDLALCEQHGVDLVWAPEASAIYPDGPPRVRAFFGEKDYQQLTLVRQLVRDLGLAVQVVAVPTVRDPDGLALSSRNVFLSPAERAGACSLSAALFAGRDAAGSAAAVLAAAGRLLRAAEGVDVDYLELRDPDLGPPPVTGPARLLVAARIGSVRLIDNIAVQLTDEGAGPMKGPRR